MLSNQPAFVYGITYLLCLHIRGIVDFVLPDMFPRQVVRFQSEDQLLPNRGFWRHQIEGRRTRSRQVENPYSRALEKSRNAFIVVLKEVWITFDFV